jgi:triphosphoribosyl-dephospho-CoA synthase
LPSEPRIAAAFLAACSDELAALKPGNVHRYADGHGMTVEEFAASAAAAAPAVAGLGSGVGQRIGEAVAASWAKVGCNTNLGIVLLCAPLALAAERLAGHGGRVAAADLARATATVLDGLTIEDAVLAYHAIAMATETRLDGIRRQPTAGWVNRLKIAAPTRHRKTATRPSGISTPPSFTLPGMRYSRDRLSLNRRITASSVMGERAT